MRRAVALLLDNDLVTLTDNPRHKQAKLLCITDRGQAMLEQLNALADPILLALRPKDVPLDAVRTTLLVLNRVSSRIDEILAARREPEPGAVKPRAATHCASAVN